jgi:hypothetical protein
MEVGLPPEAADVILTFLMGGLLQARTEKRTGLVAPDELMQRTIRNVALRESRNKGLDLMNPDFSGLEPWIL